MEQNNLPANFDKYSTIIDYFRNNRLDCLLSQKEQFRFFIRYIYSKKENNCPTFQNKLYERTTLSKTDKYVNWGYWQANQCKYIPYQFYNIDSLIFYHEKYHNNIDNKNEWGIKATKEFLYNELSKTSDYVIMDYFKELHSYGKLIEQDSDSLTITIVNNVNDAKMIIKKSSFYKYCKYSNLLTNYHDLDKITIDIPFNDNIAKYISDLLNVKSSIEYRNYNAEELKQIFILIDFLQISFNYDNVRL